MSATDPLYDAILRGDGPLSEDYVKLLLADDVPADDILKKACIPATQEARQRVEQGIFYMPDLFIALRCYLIVLESLRPHIPAHTYQQALDYGEFDITCHL